MKRSLSKKAKKVIEEGVEEFMALPPLAELTRIGARVMLQAALEEEVTIYLRGIITSGPRKRRAAGAGQRVGV